MTTQHHWVRIQFGLLTGDETNPVDWRTSYLMCYDIQKHVGWLIHDSNSFRALHPKSYAITITYEREMTQEEWYEVNQSVKDYDTKG